MATYLGTGAVFEVRSGATAGNLGGGGFNPANANFLTNGAATSATGNSPVFTSASYNFVAGDVGAWIYIKSGTNWTPGWYQIASVASNAATLSAAIGQGVQKTNNLYITQTIAGCATTASPTGATWGIDYSQQNAAQFTNAVLTGTTTTCTDATAPFGVQMVGNFICISSGTGVTAGWYEIVSVSGVTATLDRTAGTTYSACTYYLGGAVSLGGSTSGITDTIFFALGSNSATSGNRFFIKGSGTYTISGSPTSVQGNASWPQTFEGYSSNRGDRPSIVSGNQPVIACGANTLTFASFAEIWCMKFTGTGSPVVVVRSCVMMNCKAINSSATAGRSAFQIGNSFGMIVGCEGVSYRGNAFDGSVVAGFFIACYAHDSNIGINCTVNGGNLIVNCIISNCVTESIIEGTWGNIFWGNTLYGAENKLGIGISTPNPHSVKMNNIFYGFVSGFGASDTAYGGTIDYNTFNNNTSDINAATTGTFKGANDIAVNPSFTSITQRTGSTATTTAGNHLVQSGATFVTWGITAGIDCVYISAGTGVTAGIYGILSVDSETQITVDITLTANATADKTWSITQGHNFLPTGAV